MSKKLKKTGGFWTPKSDKKIDNFWTPKNVKKVSLFGGGFGPKKINFLTVWGVRRVQNPKTRKTEKK